MAWMAAAIGGLFPSQSCVEWRIWFLRGRNLAAVGNGRYVFLAGLMVGAILSPRKDPTFYHFTVPRSATSFSRPTNPSVGE